MSTPPVIDLDALLAPIPGDSPAGVSLPASAPEFDRINSHLPQEDLWFVEYYQPTPAGWERIRDLTSQCLASQSKDLRMAYRLAQALIHLHGFAGLRDGLRLFTGLLQDYWHELSPPLDEDGGGEARESVLIAFFRDTASPVWIKSVAVSPMRIEGFNGRSHEFNYSLWETVYGHRSDPLEVNVDGYRRAITLLDPQVLGQLRADLAECAEELDKFKLLSEKLLGYSRAPDCSKLREAIQFVSQWLMRIYEFRGPRFQELGQEMQAVRLSIGEAYLRLGDLALERAAISQRVEGFPNSCGVLEEASNFLFHSLSLSDGVPEGLHQSLLKCCRQFIAYARNERCAEPLLQFANQAVTADFSSRELLLEASAGLEDAAISYAYDQAYQFQEVNWKLRLKALTTPYYMSDSGDNPGVPPTSIEP